MSAADVMDLRGLLETRVHDAGGLLDELRAGYVRDALTETAGEELALCSATLPGLDLDAGGVL